MNATRLVQSISRSLGRPLLLCALAASAHAVTTSLSSEPITSSSGVSAKPNILFVLDDSGSMSDDFLPDWAGPYQALVSGVLTVATPPHRFFNGAYNGVAYNPGTRYRPPVMYTNAGALDTTTYPSQTGQSAATGGDGSASAALPNWRAVKADGYGVQSAATVNLEGNAFSYTTVAGEYCDSVQLRNCVASATPTGAYTFPAKLRWCTTSALALDTTANAGTNCQASNIDDSAANLANGVTPYTFPRIPAPRTATITVAAAGTVGGIAVDGVQILFASATGGTSTDLAADIAAKINACTYGGTGICTAVGFSAVSLANVVTVTAPGATTSTPVVSLVSGGPATPSAFSGGNVPGASLFAVITALRDSYTYPGALSKNANRSDCAGSVCTYVEEMSNYANWYSYYRTRMQMMKTASSIAFANVDNNFRVGYYTINNGAGSQFLNLSDFDGTQKNLWYSKFFSALPFGATPLRTGLANAGKLYAGKISVLNDVTANDPMQYACQQNFTILSTDGYWNDSVNPTQLDGVTEIGEQDGGDPRPYYDGGSQTRTVSQTNKTELQIGINTWLVESRTQQQQKSLSQLTQSVVTTDTYPWTTQTSTLQTQTTPLNKTDYSLVQSTYPLTSLTKQLQESTFKLNSTPRILQSYTYNLTQTTTPLQDKQFNITSVTTPLQDKQFNITSVTTPLQDKQFNITSVTTPLQDKQFNITSVTTPLQSSTYLLQSSTRQLQQNNQYSTNGGDTWLSTGWVDVSSCTVRANGPGWVRNTNCRYNTAVVADNVSTCSTVAASVTPNYTVAQAVTCAYETVPVVATVTSCTTIAQAVTSPYVPSVTCAYSGTPVTLANEVACTAVAASGGSPYSGPMRTCTFNAAAATTTDVASCTAVTPANAATPKHTCTYTGTPVTLANEVACTAVAASGGPTNYTGPMRTCTFNAAAATTTNVATCTAVTPANAATPKHTCTYTGTPVTLANEVACTAVAASGSSPYSGPMRTCTFNAAAASTTNVTTCTAVTPANAATPKHTCTYTGTPVVVNNLTTCTAVAASVGNPYTGPAVSCAYMAAVTATNLTTCTAGTPSAGPVFSSYITCGYINGTTTTGLSSCTYIADSTGPVYAGPANACAYSVTATVVNVTSCTPVAQSPTFAAPQKTCAYEAVGTPATNLASCTALAQSGSAPYAGPNVSCAYSATATLSYPGACTVNLETGPSYTAGAKVSCAYAAGVATNNVATCTAQAKQVLTTNGAAYAPARDCSYGAVTPWADAIVACVPLAQSLTSPYVGPARGCQYTAWSANTYAGTCVAAAQNNTNLTARNCVATPFPVLISTVATTVDSCSTAPTSGVSPVNGAATRSTATTCTYLAPTVASNAASCTPHAQDVTSPYTTAVTCPVSDTGYLAVAPSCTATAPPATFDGTGKIIECRTTDTTPYTVDYPSGAVPVPTCTPGTDPGTKVQTGCTTLLSTGPTPVDPTTCTTAAAAAPSYVATTCTPSTTTSSVMGCDAPAPSSPLWQTVTCVDDGTGTSNTLADVAAYYYKTDLRTPALGNCTGAIVPPATVASVLCTSTDAMNIVRTSPSDPNPAQHMTTFTLGLGASGYMKYSNTYTTDTTGDFPTVKGVSPYQPINGITANPGAGICSWESTGLCNWPYPTADAQNTVDDLWHAAVNGHGVYYSAGDPASLAAGISSALNGVAGSGGTAAAPSVSTANLNQSDNYIFSSSYATSEWTGDLVRRRLNPYTGIPLASIDWSAQGKLDANVARRIYTFASGAAIAFTSANFAANANFNMPNISTSPIGLTQFLCASPDVCLSASDQVSAAGANLVNYLRGDRTNEGIETDNSKFYRQRQHVLGDMVNAQTVYVNHPARDFIDPGYSAFRTAQASRQAVVYAGANDGMLHAFAAKGNAATEALVDAYAAAAAASAANTTDAGLLSAANSAAAAAAAALAGDPTIGQELWAYIPSMVLPNLYKLADKEYRNKHRYFVDATPVVGDICSSNCTDAATAVWKTILVGGLGHGGRGFYALDITNPSIPPIVLWEFTDANLGYSYGNPQIAKMSNGTWVVMLTSGYNNGNGDGGVGDGVGRLYVLNAQTGVQIAGVSPISTGYGVPDDPSGLVNIAAMVVDPQTDSTTVAVYGGDLSGNLWRFDINDTVGPSGVEAQLLAVLEDAAGHRQPITTKPTVTIIKNQKVVYVGTGRFLDASDSTDTSPQSLYAIKDPWTTGGSAATAIFSNPGGDRSATVRNASGFVPQFLSWTACPTGSSPSICVAGSQVMVPTGNVVNPVDFVADNGWFIDLINSSERANTNPALGLGLLTFVTNAPSLLACDIGGKSYLYFLNYLNGGPIVSPENPGGLTGYLIGNTFASAPTIVVLATPDGGVGRPEVVFGVQDPSKVGAPVICVGNVCGATPPTLPDESKARRTSWREVIAE